MLTWEKENLPQNFPLNSEFPLLNAELSKWHWINMAAPSIISKQQQGCLPGDTMRILVQRLWVGASWHGKQGDLLGFALLHRNWKRLLRWFRDVPEHLSKSFHPLISTGPRLALCVTHCSRDSSQLQPCQICSHTCSIAVFITNILIVFLWWMF